MLRGKKPEYADTKLRLFIYGEYGTGKTTTAIQFPDAYIMDLENGAIKEKYIDLLNDQNPNAVVYCPHSYDDLIDEIKKLLTLEHSFKSLVIDPLSWLYMHLKDQAEIFLSKNGKDGSEYGKNTARADKFMYRLFQLIFRLDMNVIVTAQVKNKYEGTMISTGLTYDVSKKFGNIFDLVLRSELRGDQHVAYIDKSREKGFTQGQMMPFNFQEIESRYGKELLQRLPKAIQFPSTEELEEFSRLCQLIQVPDAQIEKWLGEGRCENFDEMEISLFKKCVDKIKSKIKGEANV